MKDTITSAIKSGHGNAILYAGAIGLLVSDIVPTPADGIYFHLLRIQRDKFNRGEITPKQFWAREAAMYYGLNPLWWSVVLGAMVLTKGDYTQKMKVGLGIIGSGAVIAVILGNVKKDELSIQKQQAL